VEHMKVENLSLVGITIMVGTRLAKAAK